jgi:hypothetical protein
VCAARVAQGASQNGGVDVDLQVQNDTRPLLGAMNFSGAKLPPLCEPSQKGWSRESPQRHHQ